MKWYERYAKYHGFSINTAVEKTVWDMLQHEKEINGEYYCPQKERIADNICPCKEFRDNYICKCDFLRRK